MIKVQPERQEPYGREEIQRSGVFGRADQNDRTEFAAKLARDGGFFEGATLSARGEANAIDLNGGHP